MAIAEDKRRLATRVTAIQIVVLGCFVLLVGGFWFFQIAQHTKFREMAENNHQRTLPLRAPRGVIFDRHGRVLVENRNSFNISILREHSKNLNRTISVLAAVTGVTAERDSRDRRAPSPRAVLSPDRGHPRRDARSGRRGGRAPSGHELARRGLCRKCRRASIRPMRWRRISIGYVGEASEAQVQRSRLVARRHRRTDRRRKELQHDV